MYQAISWAHDQCQADIITMSFGYTDYQVRISTAIHDAISKRNESIIFFAAAANFGANQKEMFPARHESVISIRATTATGDFLDLNPPHDSNEGRVFGTLGLEVPGVARSQEPPSPETLIYRTGTSVATAIAAGLAGMLLECTNGMSSRPTYGAIRAKLRTRQGMLAIFDFLSSTTLHQGYWYISPWALMKTSEENRWSILETVLLHKS